MITIPEKVTALISACQRRICRILLVRGLVETGATFLATVTGVMSVDAFTVIFSEAIRYSMSVGIYALTALVAVLTLYGRLRRRRTDRNLAELLDRRHPEHEECLSTLIEIAERAKEGRSDLSPALVSVLAARCSVAAGRIDPKREFTNRRVRWCFCAMLALFSGLIVALVTMPNFAGRLFVRAVLPWVEVGNLYEDDLTVSPGDILALVGTEIRIAATADASLHSEPWIRISRKKGNGWGKEFSEPLKDGVYTVIADLSEREWRYRISAGPAVSKFYTVRVCEMPRCRSFTAEVTYPAYTGKPPITFEKDELKVIAAIEGTQVKFKVVPERTDTKSFFCIAATARTDYTMVSNRVDTWTLDLESIEGFHAPRQAGTLRSFKDQPPTVVIENPKERTLHLPNYSTFPIQFSASDDVGLKRVTINCSVDGREQQLLREIHPHPQPSTFFKGEENIDLSLIGDAHTRKVEFVLIAEDGRGGEFGGPQTVTSMPLTVSFEVRAQNWEMQDLGRKMREVEGLLREAEKRIDAVQRPVDEAKAALNRENAVSEQTEKRIEQALHEAQETLERLEDIDEILKQDGRFEPVRELVESQEERLKPIVEKLESAQFDEVDERAKELEEVLPEVKVAREEMRALEKPLRDRKADVETYEQMRDLAVRQESLAKAAEAILKERPVDTKKLDVWREMERAAIDAAKNLERKLGAVNAPDAARRKMEKSVQLMEELKREIQMDEREAKNPKAVEKERSQFRKGNAANREARLKEAEQSVKRVEEQLANAEKQLANRASAPQNLENALRAAMGEQQRMADRLEFAEADRKTDVLAAEAMEKVRAALGRAEKEKTAREQAARRKQVDEQRQKDAETATKELAEQITAAKVAEAALKEQIAAELAARKSSPADAVAHRDTVSDKTEAAAEAMRETVRSRAEAMGIDPPEFGKEEEQQSMVDQPANSAGESGRPDGSEKPSAGGILKEINAKAAELKLKDPSLLKPQSVKAGWFRIRGAAKGHLGDRELKGVPPEYRDLVRAYFLKLSESE